MYFLRKTVGEVDLEGARTIPCWAGWPPTFHNCPFHRRIPRNNHQHRRKRRRWKRWASSVLITYTLAPVNVSDTFISVTPSVIKQQGGTSYRFDGALGGREKVAWESVVLVEYILMKAASGLCDDYTRRRRNASCKC